MGSATVGFTFPRYHFETALSARAASSRKTSAANSYAAGKTYLLDPYTLLDFNVSSLDLRLIGRRLTRFSAHVNNVFNQRHAEPGYLGVDIPSSGIGVFVSITQELEAPMRIDGRNQLLATDMRWGRCSTWLKRKGDRI